MLQKVNAMRPLRYDAATHKTLWHNTLSQCKNATFLLERDFMDYHADRFTDHSLLIFDEKGEAVALLPAHERDGNWYSHQGLTYGGLLLHRSLKLSDALACWSAVVDYGRAQGWQALHYKSVPSFYHTSSTQEEEYALWMLQAECVRVDTAFVVEQGQALQLQTRRRRAVQKAEKMGIRIEKADDCSAFWQEILTPNLLERFGVQPVHSLAEIELLRQRFPDEILQFNAYLGTELLAGTTIFRTPRAAHAQYISANAQGRDTGAIDLLFYRLISEIFADLPFFSFGIANEAQGTRLNRGLMDWKEGFRTAVYAHRFYRIPLQMPARFSPLDEAE